MDSDVDALYRRIYAVVRKIPRGCVATYGQVAELAGIPGGGRVAGAAMKTSRPSDRLPWQRVIGKAGKLRGRIAIYDPVGAAVQRQLLEKEGVPVGERGLVDLGEYGWLSVTPHPRAGVARARRPARDRSPSVRAGSGRGASPRRRPRSGSKRRASSSRR